MQSFAIIPAAGRSTRMGRPKLLLPWGSSTIVETVLTTWRASGVTASIVTVHPADVELAELCRRGGADVVVANEPPADMKASVALALAHVESIYRPQPSDAWLLAPADMPTIGTDVIGELLRQFAADPTRAVLPVHAGRRGHPVILPWAWAGEVQRLGPHEGIRAFFARHWLDELPWPDEKILEDVDSPENYRHLRNRYGPND